MNCAPLIPNPFSPSDWHNLVESWNPTNWCHAFPCRARRTKPRFRNSVISHSGPHAVLKRKSPLASQKSTAKVCRLVYGKVFDGGVGTRQRPKWLSAVDGLPPIRRSHGQPQGAQPRRLTVVNYQLLGPLHFLPWMRETGWETPGRWLLPSF
ncbi:hypothetical protein V8C35DRAFT_178316 [Trichoderma chlorosporum]